MGGSRAFGIAPACCATSSGVCPLVGCARRSPAVVGRAVGSYWLSCRLSCRPSSGPTSRSARARVGIARVRRAAKARRAGDIVESARAVMGPTQTRHAAGTAAVLCSRLGIASLSIRAAADCGALLGRAGTVRVGCAKDRGARRARRAVMVSARRARSAAVRVSAAVERSGSDRLMVSAGARSGGACRAASTLNRRHACRRSRERDSSGRSAPRGRATCARYSPVGRSSAQRIGCSGGGNHDSRERRGDGLRICRES